ncbi:SoxR reducing system RseC family protein [Ketobacter sp. MCCC 1A13808]|uniref:SoxR reducing system RseC family protein n=1 Tax=Ketobacter sp. MCCC 1A13808 TaxID=2602738 RepID=UPI000F29F8EE|nr:SoxR reducing system RseC family protein [Ketobacter sp. MCCC 1A13808]MVF14690.1 SoxR reducing system RseC family protein [Ketobacter sp. MCCC 1A13808]RLP53942.1 MAG: transcriptional regulator [Ketobacter sp.]
MIEEIGKVVALDRNVAWVETVRTSACDSCSAKSGCGHSALAKLGQNHVHMQALSNLILNVGDQVVVGVPEDVMMKSSVLAYLMPLLGMMFSALVAEQLGAGDLPTALAGVSGLALGFLLLRWHFHKNQHDERYRPVVLRRIYSSNASPCENR